MNRILTSLTACVAILGASPALTAPLAEDETVLEQLMLSSVATKIGSTCKKYAIDPTATAEDARALMAHISEMGYAAEDVQALQSPDYLEKLALKSDEFLSAQDVDPANKRALCAFAKRELKGGTSELSKLLMKNR